MISNAITQWIFAWFRRTDGNIRYRPFVIRHTVIPQFGNSYYTGSFGILKVYTFPESLFFWDPASAATSFVLLTFENSIGGGYYQN